MTVIATTESRDAVLQEKVRKGRWPFRVEIRFWDDICLDLSGYIDLLEKHYPEFVKRRITMEDIERLIVSTDRDDFRMVETGCYVCKQDVNLRVIHLRTEKSDDFNEPWVRKYPDKKATREIVHIKYGDAVVKEMTFVLTDGTRYFIPLPKSISNLTITEFQYRVGRVLNRAYDFDRGLHDGGITVAQEPTSRGAE